MVRNLFALAVVGLSLTQNAAAQEWARKMFAETKHNFGSVARDSNTEFRFVFTNLYRDDLHVAGIRTSCGCTTPKVTKDTLKSHEKGEIIAHFNTDTFRGQHGATLTVTFDRPQYAEVQLRVDGNIRTDLVIKPGLANLGTVDQGSAAEKLVTIEHAGSANWRILEVKSPSPHIAIEINNRRRTAGGVTYDVHVKLADSAPVGYLDERLIVVTNDASVKEFPLSVQARVAPEIAVSPTSMVIGAVPSGEKATRQLVLRGKRPFHVISIECDDPSFTFGQSEGTKAVHLIPVTFEAGAKPGKVSQKIRIRTDLGKDVTAEISAFAEVISLAGN